MLIGLVLTAGGLLAVAGAVAVILGASVLLVFGAGALASFLMVLGSMAHGAELHGLSGLPQCPQDGQIITETCQAPDAAGVTICDLTWRHGVNCVHIPRDVADGWSPTKWRY
jgi:hypothetical protein